MFAQHHCAKAFSRPCSSICALWLTGLSCRYKVIDYGLADFEARYAAGMIGEAADKGTASAPKEETFRERRQREREMETDPTTRTKKTLSLKMNVIPKVYLLVLACKDNHLLSLCGGCAQGRRCALAKHG